MKKKTSLAAKIVLILIAIYLVTPFLATFVYSLFTEWTGVLPRGFTLRNYQELFADTDFWLAIGRTLILCAVSVLITIVLLLLAMYPITVMNRKLGKYMQFICMIPYALQGVILSISIISIYAGMNGVLSNRMFMLFGAYSILVLPYIYQGIRNSLNAIDAKTLIQAAEVLGCSRFRAYVQVILPNIFSGILVSSLLAESIVFGDFVQTTSPATTTKTSPSISTKICTPLAGWRAPSSSSFSLSFSSSPGSCSSFRKKIPGRARNNGLHRI